MRARNVCPQLQCEAPSLCCVSAYVCVSLVVHVFLFVCAHLYGIFVPSGPLLLKTHQHCHINTTHINTTHINIVTSTQHTSTQHTSTLSHVQGMHLEEARAQFSWTISCVKATRRGWVIVTRREVLPRAGDSTTASMMRM